MSSLTWAALFPGQGSQHPGMGRFLYDNFKSAQELFEEASDILSLNFKKLCFEGPEQDLALTENTQPCLLLVSTATYKAVTEVLPIQFKFTAGHSVGEYAAMVAAGTLQFQDALQAVRTRGQAMQSAVPVGEGAMAAVMGLSGEQVKKLCMWGMEQSGHHPLEPANFNAPGQIVISGSSAAINWLGENLSKDIFDPAPKKVRLIPLKVSAPFHCSMMKPAEEKMNLVLKNYDWAKPAFPVVQNVNASAVSDPVELCENLVRQISAPVRWVESVQYMEKEGVCQALELGSGKVLTGLNKKISEKIEMHSVNTLDDLKALEVKFEKA